MKIELQFIRTQLKTLFTIPPMLVALRSMTQDWWEEINQKPAYNANGHPMQLDENFLEKRIADELQMLDRNHDRAHYLHEVSMADQLDQESLEEQIVLAPKTVMQTLQGADDIKRIIIDNDHLHDHIDAAKQQLLLTLETAIRNTDRGETMPGNGIGEMESQTETLAEDAECQTLTIEQCDQSTQIEPRTQANRKVQTDRKLVEKRSQAQSTTRQHPTQTTKASGYRHRAAETSSTA
ncbi:hypothetical protein RB195_013531 [Necator americanus]|uniref:Uncharacterized protein n=1 Tax=Necator americanus TaxID=51031 RepID=A0ABR1DW01_NECAM